MMSPTCTSTNNVCLSKFDMYKSLDNKTSDGACWQSPETSVSFHPNTYRPGPNLIIYNVTWSFQIYGPFWTCQWAFLDPAMGFFRHVQNLWAILVRGVLVHWPFWYRPFAVSIALHCELVHSVTVTLCNMHSRVVASMESQSRLRSLTAPVFNIM